MFSSLCWLDALFGLNGTISDSFPRAIKRFRPLESTLADRGLGEGNAEVGVNVSVETSRL